MSEVKIDKQDIPKLTQMANTLRFLCADMVQNANSGHPGAPMGLADIASTLSFFININPKQSNWLNRDRIIFSGGHASALVYSLLHLWGFELSLEDLKAFRQLDSKTPGHPEYKHTHGVEITTGPLGQGIANAVGLAMASLYAKNCFGKEIFNHKVYCFCGDGDLQEGISYEACALAGHHKLSNLILIYDCNNITIEGSTDIAWSENVESRFIAQGFSVLHCNGHDYLDIAKALNQANNATKPTIIIAKTIIAKGSKNLSGSHKSHGAPLGAQEIAESKKSLGLEEKEFFVPDSVKFAFGCVADRGELAYTQWLKAYENLPSITKERLDSMLNPNFESICYPTFDFSQNLATRITNNKILNAIANSYEGLIGGSADLAPSNNTNLENLGDFPNGRNWHFGIREHAMGAISNGVANYGLFLPFCATFFVFSDYMSASVRVAALMKAQVFYIWTHDSIGVGEDGCTHQPIEQLSHFRAMPNLLVFRPADGNENVACWQVALDSKLPCAFVLSRQNLPTITPYTNSLKGQIAKGGYLVKSASKPKVTLLASGSEVSLALDSANALDSLGIATQVMSVPCFDLLLKQPKSYIKQLCENSKIIAIEASRGLEWYVFAQRIINMDSFGASGKGDLLFKKFGFSVDNVIKIVQEELG